MPDEEKGPYHTISGIMLLRTGRIPKEGDTVAGNGWSFEIVDMDRKRIDKVMASRTPVPADVPALLSS